MVIFFRRQLNSKSDLSCDCEFGGSLIAAWRGRTVPNRRRDSHFEQSGVESGDGSIHLDGERRDVNRGCERGG